MTNNENKKSVKNQLFNASVTGGTYEDFSHNAILFPAHEIPTASNTPLGHQATHRTTPDIQPENLIHSPAQEEIPLGDNLQQENPVSQLSSLFSSFSNILTFSEEPPQPVNISNPTLPPQSIPQDYQITENVTPVPLFPLTHSDTVLSPSPGLTSFQNKPPLISNSGFPPQETPSGSNTYRRQGTKKIAYAQIPGLLNSAQSSGPSITNPVPSPSFPPSIPNVPPVNLNIQQHSSLFQPTSIPDLNLFGTTRAPSSILEETVADLSVISDNKPGYYGISTTTASAASISAPQFFNPSVFTSEHLTLQSTTFTPSSSTTTSLMHPLLEAEVATGNLRNRSISPARITAVSSQVYRPVYHHWFYKKEVEKKTQWQPFSMIDSLALEEGYTSTDISLETVVPTDGGRYDVNILRRERSPVYWKSEPSEVRRCSWFYKGPSNGRFIPYEENVATMLENEYKVAFEKEEWHRKVELPSGDAVVMHGPDVLALFPPAAAPDAWGNTPQQTNNKLKVIKRGLDEFDIDEGEPNNVDHLIFMVHGIGSVCDLKFRTVEEVVDEFRDISLQLTRSHYRTACDNGEVGRIEVLPISWHSQLHSEETGIDKILKSITLESIPRLRNFTNDTLLDILFYTSPMYCQTIINTVGTELNRIYELFQQRNPSFKGGVSLGGHSLGSLIVFDLLCHQHPVNSKEQTFEEEDDDVVAPLVKPLPNHRHLSRRISYMMSAAGTGQPELQYPQLNFQPSAFFALGSPIGMFVTVRGLDTLGIDFTLPTCPAFFNIFHPYDPVAYRIESLLNSEFAEIKPVLIPHHKGRKRMHLELQDTITRVGADLKQKIVDSMKSTFNSLFPSYFGRQDTRTPPNLEEEVHKVLEEKLAEESKQLECQASQSAEEHKTDLHVGALNKGRRIDYVLQEAPFEFFNEYIFALTSHIGYWESEDTILLILKEIYETRGISPDNRTPQPSMIIEKSTAASRTSGNKPFYSNSYPSVSLQASNVGMNPTMPISSNVNVGPPPMQGFVKKS